MFQSQMAVPNKWGRSSPVDDHAEDHGSPAEDHVEDHSNPVDDHALVSSATPRLPLLTLSLALLSHAP